MHQPSELSPDADRGTTVGELVALQAQVHDRAVALVGPMPLPPDLTMQQVRVLALQDFVRESGW